MASRSLKPAARSGGVAGTQVELHEAAANASQDELASAVAKMLETNNRRRAAKRQQYEKDLRSLFDRHRKQLATLHEEHQTELNKLRRSNVSKLATLLQSRSEIESEIATATKTLLSAYAATSHEMRLVLDERVAALRDTGKPANA